MFTCRTEEEARVLVARTCRLNYDNEYVAPELVEEQTLENLAAFSDRLNDAAKELGYLHSEE